jgi:hypothetical protein
MKGHLRDLIKPVNVANGIRMHMDLHKGAFVLVEGETDRSFFANFLNREKCKIKVGDGKRRVVKILQNLQGANRVFGIVDADHWPITGDVPPFENLFTTDTTDVESLVIKSDAFAKTLNNYCDADSLEKLVESCGLNEPAKMRDMLVKGAAKIGFLRFMNEKERTSVDFKPICFVNFVCPDDFEVDENALCAEFAKQKTEWDELVRRWLDVSKQRIDDPWKFACGHDLVSILLVGLCNSSLGYRSSYHKSEIEGGLRKAYERIHFAQTDLCKKIEEWSNLFLGTSIVSN